MKAGKWLAITGLVLGSGMALAACSNNSNGSGKVYSYVFQQTPDTLDYLLTQKGSTSDITSNLIDGLLENDKYGNFVPSLAEDWTVSSDGKTYTYKLRKGAKWYTSDGEEYAEVKAQDFVAGLKHAADSKSEALYLVQDSVAGLADYISGNNKDFSSVGVKAIDDYTVQYTLNQAESFWNSKTTMGILYPVNEDFLKSQGDKFGSANDVSSLLYNGPFILKNLTAKSTIEMAKNENYWDKENVKLNQIKLTYYDGQDQDSLVRNFKDGAYSVAAVYPTSSNYASVEKEYKDNIVYSPQDATTYFYAFNFDRQSYKLTSKKSDAEKEATKKALMNKDFRQALNFAFDRTAYAAQSNGQAGADKILRSSLVPSNFVQVGDKTFAQVADEKIVSYGQEWAGVNTADAQDSIHDDTKAKAEFDKAKEALSKEGVSFPIHLDIAINQSSTAEVNKASSLKQSIEDALGSENVQVDLQKVSEDDYNNATYMAQTAAQKDYDLALVGWSPDYEDPSSYLDILDPDKGALAQFLGFEPGQSKELVGTVGLDSYQGLLKEANAEQEVASRYEKYANAQAWLTDSSILLPVISSGGTPSVRKTVPFTAANSLVGYKGRASNYKLYDLQDSVVTSKDYEAAYKKWQEEKATSNEKAQADLSKHVKD